MFDKLRSGSKQTARSKVFFRAVLPAFAVVLVLSSCSTTGSDTKNMSPEQKSRVYSKPYKPKSVVIPQLNDTIATVEMSWKEGVMHYALTVDKSFDLQTWLEEHPKGSFVVTWEKNGTTFGGFNAPFKEFKPEGNDLKYEGHADCGSDRYDDLYANREDWGLSWAVPGE
jgi:hypothetical protein